MNLAYFAIVRDITPESRQEIDHALGELDGTIEAGSPVWWTGEDAAAAENLAAARALGIAT